VGALSDLRRPGRPRGLQETVKGCGGPWGTLEAMSGYGWFRKNAKGPRRHGDILGPIKLVGASGGIRGLLRTMWGGRGHVELLEP
jgi:hypothetical protein